MYTQNKDEFIKDLKSLQTKRKYIDDAALWLSMFNTILAQNISLCDPSNVNTNAKELCHLIANNKQDNSIGIQHVHVLYNESTVIKIQIKIKAWNEYNVYTITRTGNNYNFVKIVDNANVIRISPNQYNKIMNKSIQKLIILEKI